MLTYFIFSGIANVLFSYYLLNQVESKGAVEYVNTNGQIKFYIVSFLLGFAVIPALIAVIFYVLFIEK